MLFYYIIFSIHYLKKRIFNLIFNQQLLNNYTLDHNLKKNNLHIPSFFLTNWILRSNQTNTPLTPKKSYIKLTLSLVWPQLISCGPAYLMIMIGANLNIYLRCYHTNFRLYLFGDFKVFSIFPIKNELRFYDVTRS